MAALGRAAAPAAGIAAAAVLLWNSRGLDDVVRAGQLGPSFWPRVVLIGLVLSCLARLLAPWLARHTRRPPAAAPPTPSAPAAHTPREIATLAAAMAAILLYAAATPWVGFPLATCLFVLAFMRLCGARSWPGMAASAALGCVSLLYLFVKLVYLPLPKGQGPFEAFTLGLYQLLRIF
ncbi:MAG TPA: tripartite tricarboxylate transporter TctB family protein [Methylomirabilota bacterium]|nr:tripartite tricarboxylate transporter TctB family protein [Methylomirabilota bacterium]